MRNAEGKQEDIGTYSFIISPSFTHFFEQLDESRAMWEDLKLSTTTELRHQHEREVVRQVYRRRPKRKVDEDTGIERKGMDGRGRKDEQGPPTKRARFTAPVAEVEAPVRRSGPVTRAMTRAAQNTGPTTRAAARRMREAAASKNQTATATATKTRKSRR
ncbi:other/FunK1 protein kinase [Coprinopsis cinerea okayama7|uniref:Other/FunK1 protein kinase n=1 Tax=Coprinopsis cinerea (strain Okayama-7 / 130 / ATCC MYA-4618 / FGSC 9003) TaxID=240176 RepID=A8NAZ5_COPC7|nr:other/FunK1 protein kinase [Coprinopsis cinerea okayama7\|eukprot:XP_001831997.2 other/FunK1 protein kinase [Coprinopsis cinerea okayama7\